MLKVINLFAGPGAGKSTIAAEVFAKMKMKHLNVELVTEFAKDLVWEGSSLSDQLYIVGNQNHRLTRLIRQVDYVIVDSPLIMNLAYVQSSYLPNSYENMVVELWSMYQNYNFFLERTQKYQKIGREQTEEEAKAKDSQIKGILSKYMVDYHIVAVATNSSDIILEKMKIPANNA